ncbi:hypothetical protein PAMA_015328 [Pampus argenteus]
MKITVCFVLVLCALSAAGERIQARLNEKVTIKCGTFSESLLWYHGTDEVYSTKFINRNLIKVNKIGGRATLKNADLIIDKVKEEDVGEYTCSADGTPYTHTLFVMSVSVNSVNASRELQQGSKVTLKCEVKGLNSDSSVKWKQPNGNQLYESPTVDLEYVTPSHAGVWVCMFSHLGNTYNESLDLTVTDLTSTSQTPKVTSVQTPPSSVASELLGLSWWMWVAVGVGSLVVVFLMVLVIILCKRIKRKKKRVLKMKNMRQPLKPREYCKCDHQTAAAKPQQGRRREKPSALCVQPLLPETHIEERRERQKEREGVRGREGRK